MDLFRNIRITLIRWLIGKSTVIANALIEMDKHTVTVTSKNSLVYGSTIIDGQLLIVYSGCDVVDCRFLTSVWRCDKEW